MDQRSTELSEPNPQVSTSRILDPLSYGRQDNIRSSEKFLVHWRERILEEYCRRVRTRDSRRSQLVTVCTYNCEREPEIRSFMEHYG